MKFLAPALALASSNLALLSAAAPTAETANSVKRAGSSPSGLSTVTDIPKGAVGLLYGILEGACSADWKCTVTVTGSIQSLLSDGDKYTGQASVSGWCDQGKCYGSVDAPVTATAPFTITCDDAAVSGKSSDGACTGTLYGEVSAIFANGDQIELWGWLKPTGYCKEGTCYASLSALGDPMY